FMASASSRGLFTPKIPTHTNPPSRSSDIYLKTLSTARERLFQGAFPGGAQPVEILILWRSFSLIWGEAACRGASSAAGRPRTCSWSAGRGFAIDVDRSWSLPKASLINWERNGLESCFGGS
ncbi:MAG: hypothetical protein DRP00_06310, partial [Candidatus Aenigmatarchaeota archaeon]